LSASSAPCQHNVSKAFKTSRREGVSGDDVAGVIDFIICRLIGFRNRFRKPFNDDTLEIGSTINPSSRSLSVIGPQRVVRVKC
jgi:hypothetical protein